jgi:hypothetical protein
MAEVKTGELSLALEEPEGAGKNTNDSDIATKICYENLTDSLADVAGGMGRHLGVFSCTMLMYVLSYPTPPHPLLTSLLCQCW